ARKVSAEAPPLGIVGDPVSFSGCLSTKGTAIIQGTGNFVVLGGLLVTGAISLFKGIRDKQA
ncbi:hypothetical protein, partial [Hymenobacter terricola]|uniref:hypothetical protein n=1 Tax=Hymenobacter terricola TaxID=2819236 RepID=UPI001CF2EA0E